MISPRPLTETEIGYVVGFVLATVFMGGPIILVWGLLNPVTGRVEPFTVYLLGVVVGMGPTWVMMYYSEEIGASIESLMSKESPDARSR